ncbi:MAG: glycogen synthase GlgA [Gammaproteobacteria bacterium]|nr:glycogen synthase GlgA [Gammaproteobacteria bacterium]
MADPLRVLFATPEAHPLAKTGGLGDVGGALPQAILRLGADARLLLPAYPGLVHASGAVPLGRAFQALPEMETVQLFEGLLPESDVPVYLVNCPTLFNRDGGPYVDANGRDWPDNALRFGMLSRVAALFGTGEVPGAWVPDILHCNDWQTGLAPAYLAFATETRTRSIFSIHNMAFQGIFPKTLMPSLQLPWSSYNLDGLEYYDQISFLKSGIVYADHITTVSPTYAREIQTAELAFGLEGPLRARAQSLTGILNGVDVEHWNPSHDIHIPKHFQMETLARKSANKRALQERLHLAREPDTPLVGMVSRMTPQKGVDLVLGIVPDMLEQPIQLAVLGEGEVALERRWRQLAIEHPQRVSVDIGYDEPLAHLIEAGADIFLMPSRFEPCGLNQMYSMMYGTPPVARRTGGLADSVVDATPMALSDGTATGFLFDGATEAELYSCILRALLLYRDKKDWRQLQVNGMKQDFSWAASAARYMEIYDQMMAKPLRRQL